MNKHDYTIISNKLGGILLITDGILNLRGFIYEEYSGC